MNLSPSPSDRLEASKNNLSTIVIHYIISGSCIYKLVDRWTFTKLIFANDLNLVHSKSPLQKGVELVFPLPCIMAMHGTTTREKSVVRGSHCSVHILPSM